MEYYNIMVQELLLKLINNCYLLLILFKNKGKLKPLLILFIKTVLKIYLLSNLQSNSCKYFG